MAWAHPTTLCSPCARSPGPRTIVAATSPSFITAVVVCSGNGQAAHPSAAEGRLPPDPTRPCLLQPTGPDLSRSPTPRRKYGLPSHFASHPTTNRLRITPLSPSGRAHPLVFR
ncbi:hypothetical protein LY76DRAFT_598958 [Colletotrichum caudatum]|nr:hypothetical protein LY76DRAFT_598958 [Colletotrichum caudatum]